MNSGGVEKVIIIGSGPAGLTAAIYASRALLNPLMIEGEEPGGQLTTTTDVENFPGFPDGVMGPELMAIMRKQAERFGTRIISSNVTEVDFSQRPFKIRVGNKEFSSQAVIISTGASAKYLGLEAEKKLLGRGVSACATCDGAFFRNAPVAVVGGGDTAMEEASFLTRFASKVFIIHRREEFKASKIMLEKAQNNPKIQFITNSVVEDIFGEKSVEKLQLKNIKTQETFELEVQGFFLGIGHQPNTKIFASQLKTDENGYLLTRPSSSHTSIEGVFAAGDVQDHIYRQAITAAGSGCMAAMDCERWLADQS